MKTFELFYVKAEKQKRTYFLSFARPKLILVQ